MRVLVCGGRNYVDRQALYHALDELHRLRKFELLIAGGARGADTLAEKWANDRNIPTEIYHAACCLGERHFAITMRADPHFLL